jgi:hypothetical protein
VKHGNPRLSDVNNTTFIATADDLQAEVYEDMKLGENLQVCKSAMMTDDPNSDEHVSTGLTNLNTIFVANQMLGNSPKYEKGGSVIESSDETGIEGYVPMTFSRTVLGSGESITENFGFKFTVSEEGTLLWSKRGS